MKQRKRFTARLMFGLGSTVIAASMSSALASSGYVLNSANTVVTSDFGECV